MSIQTGAPRHDGPPSRRLGDRVRAGYRQFLEDPNPIWIREMRQAGRLLGTPVALAAVTILVTLLLGAVGGAMNGGRKSPAEVGYVLFQVFFSLAYFIVALVGPALGANAIASEREGRTWEALLLTGLRPEVVARGKFLSAYTSIALYVVMLAPAGAVPFLFGGVTPFEVVVAFLLLFAIALVAVGFGLAVSAKMQSMRGALVVALLSAVPLSGMLFSFFGVAGSMLAHRHWFGGRGGGEPIWLPRALGAAPFGWDYVGGLCVVPALLLGLPAWFLYEATLTNLKSVTEDRSYGLKRWFLATEVAVVTVCTTAVAIAPTLDIVETFVAACLGLLGFHVFAAFLFATEAIGPSRRVDGMLAGRGSWRQRLGPGVGPTVVMLRMAVMASNAVLALVAKLVAEQQLPTTLPPASWGGYTVDAATRAILVCSAFAWGLAEFLVGVAAFLRARKGGSAGGRIVLFAVLFLSQVGPWVVAALVGAFDSGGTHGLVVAAPSLFFGFGVTLTAVLHHDSEFAVAMTGTLVAAAAYGLLGMMLGSVGIRRCRAVIDEHRQRLAEADARLAEEDARARAAREASSAASTRAAGVATSVPEPPAAAGVATSVPEPPAAAGVATSVPEPPAAAGVATSVPEPPAAAEAEPEVMATPRSESAPTDSSD